MRYYYVRRRDFETKVMAINVIGNLWEEIDEMYLEFYGTDGLVTFAEEIPVSEINYWANKVQQGPFGIGWFEYHPMNGRTASRLNLLAESALK